MIRQAGLERLTNLLQDDAVAPTGGHEYACVEQFSCRSVGRCVSTRDPINRHPQVGGLDRLSQEVVHAGREAPIAVFYPRTRRQGDDGQVPTCRSFAVANRFDDLETVEFWHVDV